MSHDIRDILGRLDAIAEDIGPEQRSVKQLPALFKPKNTSPQIGGKYPGDNATRGYLVGEDEETMEGDVVSMTKAGSFTVKDREDYLDKRDLLFRALTQNPDAETKAAIKSRLADLELAAKNAGVLKENSDSGNPMRDAVIGRISRGRLDLIEKYGLDAVMDAVDDVTEGDTDWEEIGSSDVSAYVKYVEDHLSERFGGEDVTEEIDKQEYNKIASELNAARQSNAMERVKQLSRRLLDLKPDGVEIDIKGQVKPMTEAQATEDVLSTMKKKLGDYLQDVATAIQKDPDLKDKIPQAVDQIKSVKTITTDDGKEIKIHGNEDDGFRVTIKNKEIKTPFRSLDEAVMAVEMYCRRRRNTLENADYVEEKRS